MIYKFIIQINNGVLTAVYGNPLPEDIAVEFILRDMDNISEGDPDPLDQEDTGNFINYY